MTPHPNAGKTCRCGHGKASAYDGKCGNCRSRRERREVERMRGGWSREAARRGYMTADEKAVFALEDLD